MSLPSLSCSLSTLPQARSLEQVQLHPSSMSAQLAAESEAKVRFALSARTHFPVFTHPLATAPQSPFKIGHSVPPIIDRDTSAQPAIFALSSTHDEGVCGLQFHIPVLYRS